VRFVTESEYQISIASVSRETYIALVAFVSHETPWEMTMLALLDQTKEPFVATEEEALIAREAVSKLKPLAEAKTDIKLRVAEKGADIVVPIPARAVSAIVDFLIAMTERKPFSVIPHSAELTTKQAADFLNVSRPFLVGLLDRGKIPHRLVGTHRRVLMADLIEHQKESDQNRRKAIAAMVAESRKLGIP
jgi:excisionase family DNA binding protein